MPNILQMTALIRGAGTTSRPGTESVHGTTSVEATGKGP